MARIIFGRHEDSKAERRREFVRRMERKWEFKHSLQHPSHQRYLIR